MKHPPWTDMTKRTRKVKKRGSTDIIDNIVATVCRIPQNNKP
jgi:hypothetical protein